VDLERPQPERECASISCVVMSRWPQEIGDLLLSNDLGWESQATDTFHIEYCGMDCLLKCHRHETALSHTETLSIHCPRQTSGHYILGSIKICSSHLLRRPLGIIRKLRGSVGTMGGPRDQGLPLIGEPVPRGGTGTEKGDSQTAENPRVLYNNGTMTKKDKSRDKSQGRCVFCGGTGLSKEHIWSDWMGSLFPRNSEHGESWSSMNRDGGSTEIGWTVPPISSARQGSVFQRKVRVVCKRCNNGWMSRVVDRAKPHAKRMILGETFQLNREEQTDLAAWIGITTVIQEFANRLGARRIPPEDRTVLINTEAPPLSWSIWIAGYAGKSWAPMRHHHIPMVYSKPPSDEEPNPPSGALQLTTFTLRELLVHVFTSTQAERIEAYRSYIHGASNSEKLQQLWPIVGNTLNWPPSLPFRDREVNSLAFDWVENQLGPR